MTVLGKIAERPAAARAMEGIPAFLHVPVGDVEAGESLYAGGSAMRCRVPGKACWNGKRNDHDDGQKPLHDAEIVLAMGAASCGRMAGLACTSPRRHLGSYSMQAMRSNVGNVPRSPTRRSFLAVWLGRRGLLALLGFVFLLGTGLGHLGLAATSLVQPCAQMQDAAAPDTVQAPGPSPDCDIADMQLGCLHVSHAGCLLFLAPAGPLLFLAHDGASWRRDRSDPRHDLPASPEAPPPRSWQV
ncbi:hypothetical protein [Afifella pfennigii]|uniref:hypothetical protein n=1 Tax=Afifella pfennigii TaxID=209897 RepID=UPI00146FAF7C|nr:hypothetical protein [Afifella pfennigii]